MAGRKYRVRGVIIAHFAEANSAHNKRRFIKYVGGNVRFAFIVFSAMKSVVESLLVEWLILEYLLVES